MTNDIPDQPDVPQDSAFSDSDRDRIESPADDLPKSDGGVSSPDLNSPEPDRQAKEVVPPDRPSHSDRTAGGRLFPSGGSVPFWLILAVVLGSLFLWNRFFRPFRYEIPIMKLVTLIDQGNPGRSTSEPQKMSENGEKRSDSGDGSQEGAPSVTVEEGVKNKRQLVIYSRLKDVCLSPYEVTGTITRQVLTPASEASKPSEVEFFAGRSGLNYDNNELFNRLQKAGFENVRAKGSPSFLESYGLTLLTTFLVLGFLFFLLRKIGTGSMAFGQNRGILVGQEDIDVSFCDVAGVDEAVEELREIVDFLQRPEKFQALGGRIPKGVLLVGPPGTGKTLLAKAVAGEAKVPFFSLSGSDFVEIYAGVGAARVRDLFQQAKKSGSAIIFIDELDALGRARSGASLGGAHDEREQTLNALLVEMDGFGTNSGTIVIAATNRPEILDSALLRSGRFDRQVLVDRPDIRGREEILKLHAKNVRLDESVDLHQVAQITSGFVGADLGSLVNEAALLAARAGKEAVTMEELTEGVERVTAGLQKKRRVITESEKNRVSYHECGHALMAKLLPNTDPVHKISIIPRGLAALGYTLQRPDDERYLMTRNELENRIQILLAGTVAEELVFADVSTGAQNDLERATEIARNMVMNFGMSRLGRVSFRDSARSAWLSDYDVPAARDYSPRTAWRIDREVKMIIDSLYTKTTEALAGKREILCRLAERLLEKEVLDTAEINAIIEEKPSEKSLSPV